MFSKRCSTTTPTQSRLLSYTNTRNRFWQQSCQCPITSLPNALLQELLWCHTCASSSCLWSAAFVRVHGSAKQSRILFLLQPWHCGHTADAPTSHPHEPAQEWCCCPSWVQRSVMCLQKSDYNEIMFALPWRFMNRPQCNLKHPQTNALCLVTPSLPLGATA